jgi:hypothetical protein
LVSGIFWNVGTFVGTFFHLRLEYPPLPSNRACGFPVHPTIASVVLPERNQQMSKEEETILDNDRTPTQIATFKNNTIPKLNELGVTKLTVNYSG